MEKSTPHCKLQHAKALIEAGHVRMTQSAVIGGRVLGLDEDGIVAILLALTPADFHKSMTTHADHRIWQDVYRPHTVVGDVYLKFTVLEDLVLVSFKEL